MFRWRRNRSAARREAHSTRELVLQIGEDKSRGRFQPTPPGTERPRDVFLSAVDEVAAVLAERGYRYARSGPHASLRQGKVSARIRFGSSHLNVPGELVSLHISLQVLDAQLGRWRKDQEFPRCPDDVVATWHLGHLLDPSRWLDWNLAAEESRTATVADIIATLERVGLTFADELMADLQGEVDLALLAGRVDLEALIEYYVRAGRSDEMGPLITATLSTFHPGGRRHFREQVERFRADGLPEQQVLGEPNGLAYLVAQFDLPFDAR